MRRSCDECGKPYEAQRSSSKYCSSSCRVRHGQKPKPEAGGSDFAGLLEVTRSTLTSAGKVDTPLGRQALVLAKRIAAPTELGSAVASLSREFRAVMAEALADAAQAMDPLDELKARRDRKRTG